MPRFSKTSKKRLLSCDSRIQTLFNNVVKTFDITIICGYRGEREQNEAYDNGYSRVRYPGSKHNTSPSLAVDVAPFPIDWDNIDRFIAMGYYVLGVASCLEIPVRWGADWDRDFDISDQTFMDYPHFELITNNQ